MIKRKTQKKKVTQLHVHDRDFFRQQWEESWTYIKTVVDVLREPILILDKNLCVMAANEPFYRTFQVDARETEGKNVYELGNGQWNIPALRKLLEEILPNNTFFKGFEVVHTFPSIGRKVMFLSARQIHTVHNGKAKNHPPIILLAIEDVTEMMNVADTLAGQVRKFETSFNERTERLETIVEKLIKDLKKGQTKS